MSFEYIKARAETEGKPPEKTFPEALDLAREFWKNKLENEKKQEDTPPGYANALELIYEAYSSVPKELGGSRDQVLKNPEAGATTNK